MNEELRTRYVRDIFGDLQQVGGARFEKWIRPLWDHIAGAPVEANGLNREGAPIAGHLDAYWPDGSVAEATSDQKFFTSPFSKVRNDFKHARQEAPDARTIRLFNSRERTAKAIKLQQRVTSRLQRLGFTLDLWDGRRIAEYIVDKLLLDERFVQRVADVLPNLRRISEQAAASARLPPLSDAYKVRPEEAQLLSAVQAQAITLVAGMGGLGKTELACAVAHRLRDGFELVVWVDADRLDRLDDLSAYDVRLNGYHLNIRGLLKAHKTLLVLDNLAIDIDLKVLASWCGAGTRVILTSQVEFGEAPYQLPFLDRDIARAVLSEGAPEVCPDDFLDVILAAIDGHPLVLRLLNRFAVQGSPWATVAAQCATAAGLADDSRQTVAARILSQHLDVLGPELAFFAWAGTATVDRGLFEAIFGLGGVDKLDRWALTARGQSDAIRLHDVVFASVDRIRGTLPIDVAELDRKLEGYLAANLSPKGLPFFRVVNRHRDLIETRLAANPRPGALRYGYLHSLKPVQLDPNLIGDPTTDVGAKIVGDRKAHFLSIVEAIEADYRRVRDQGNKLAAQATLTERLAVFDNLLTDKTMRPDESVVVRHHRAKSFLKLGDSKKALEEFEDILTDGQPHFATRLQVARLLDKDPNRAKALVFEIVEAELDAPGTVAISVLIETLATVRRKHLRNAADEMTERFGSFMAQQIKAAACSGEAQPIRAFAAIGPKWAYEAPELFIEVLEEIDLGQPADAEDDDERVAVGRLLTAAGKQLLRSGRANDAEQFFERAVSYLRVVKRQTAFLATHLADALLRLERADEAMEALEKAPVEGREDFWRLRRSEAYLQLGQFEPALTLIDEALGSDLQEFKATFLAQRAEILRANGDAASDEALVEAIAACKNDLYRAELTKRLEEWKSG